MASYVRSLVIAVLAVFVLAAAPGQAFADSFGNSGYSYSDPNSMSPVIDVLVFRPVGIALTAAGTATFVVFTPFSVWSPGAFRALWLELVTTPARFTFTRPVGYLGPDPTLVASRR